MLGKCDSSHGPSCTSEVAHRMLTQPGKGCFKSAQVCLVGKAGEYKHQMLEIQSLLSTVVEGSGFENVFLDSSRAQRKLQKLEPQIAQPGRCL